MLPPPPDFPAAAALPSIESHTPKDQMQLLLVVVETFEPLHATRKEKGTSCTGPV